MLLNASSAYTVTVMGVPAVAVPGAETRKCVAVVTVMTAGGLEVSPLCIAVILEVPPCRPLTCPCEPAVLLTLATVVFEEAHVAVVVKFVVLLSE